MSSLTPSSERSSAGPDREGLLPPWARGLVEQYRGGTLNLFVVHGQIHDLVPMRATDGTRFVPLREFLSQALFPGKDGIIFYDQASGYSFSSNDLALDFHKVADSAAAASGGKPGMGLPREPGRALPLAERYMRMRLSGGSSKRLALVIEYAQTVVPAADGGSLSEEEETCLVLLTRWATDPQFLRADITIVLVTPSMLELHPGLVQNPYVGKHQIDLPDELERLEFIQGHLSGDTRALTTMPATIMAALSSGLSRVNILHMLEQALRNRRTIDHEFVYASKKEIIEKECYGLLEFAKPEFSLDMVSGHEGAKKWLQDDARLLKDGKLGAVPMGYLICGPVGTGKTFLIKCFTGSIGIPCVMLKNFRSQWQGATESNMEKILTVLRATGPVAVIIDEADAALGDRDSSGDSGTSGRVFSQIATQMGDTRYRGKIVWFLLTCRPDLLPVDLKRQGRAEVHIPLFYPEGAEEIRKFFEIMARKVKLPLPEGGLPPLPEHASLSGADIEGVMVRVRRRVELAGQATPTAEDFKEELDAFVPSVSGPEVELQIYAALSECTDRRFLPETYKAIPRDRVLMHLAELKRLVEG